MKVKNRRCCRFYRCHRGWHLWVLQRDKPFWKSSNAVFDPYSDQINLTLDEIFSTPRVFKLRILYVPLEVKKNHESNNFSVSEMPLLNELHLGARHKTHSGYLPTNRQPPRYTSHDDLRNLPAVSEQSSDFFTSIDKNLQTNNRPSAPPSSRYNTHQFPTYYNSAIILNNFFW